MNPKHVMADTIPMIALNMRAIFDFVRPEGSRDIFKLNFFFLSLSKLKESNKLLSSRHSMVFIMPRTATDMEETLHTDL